VIEIAEGIPFIEMTDWDHEKLYSLKGELVQSGIKSVTGMDMPVFPKRRFQHGAVSGKTFGEHFPKGDLVYRKEFQRIYE
jgi:asparagine synthase (glutamine-hydrolysing)